MRVIPVAGGAWRCYDGSMIRVYTVEEGKAKLARTADEIEEGRQAWEELVAAREALRRVSGGVLLTLEELLDLVQRDDEDEGDGRWRPPAK